MKSFFSGISGFLCVFAGAFVFFLFTLVANFSASHDSITYLNEITKSNHLFHQHHLLYNYTASLWLRLLHMFLPVTAPYLLIESFTALWGAGNIAMVWLILKKRFSLSPALALASCLPVAFSFGPWFYSVNIEVYAPSVFFILVLIYLLSVPLSRKSVWMVILMHILAVLFHQVNILFSVIVFYAFWKNRKHIDFRTSSIIYIVAGVFVTGSLYLYAGWIVENHNDWHSFGSWLLGYTVGHDYWRPLTVQTPAQAASGFFHAFVGGHFLFQLPFIRSFLEHSFVAHNLQDEIFLSTAITAKEAWLLLAVTIVLILLMIYLLFGFVLSATQMWRKYRPVLPLIAQCFLLYSVFFCFWMPENLEFWILQSVLFWLVLMGTAPSVFTGEGWKALIIPVITGTLLLFVNYTGSMKWLRSPERDWYYAQMKRGTNASAQKDLIVLQKPWILQDYYEYFSDRKVIAIPASDSALTGFRGDVRKVLGKGGKIIFFGSSPVADPASMKKQIDSLAMMSSSSAFTIPDSLQPPAIIIK